LQKLGKLQALQALDGLPAKFLGWREIKFGYLLFEAWQLGGLRAPR